MRQVLRNRACKVLCARYCFASTDSRGLDVPRTARSEPVSRSPRGTCRLRGRDCPAQHRQRCQCRVFIGCSVDRLQRPRYGFPIGVLREPVRCPNHVNASCLGQRLGHKLLDQRVRPGLLDPVRETCLSVGAGAERILYSTVAGSAHTYMVAQFTRATGSWRVIGWE